MSSDWRFAYLLPNLNVKAPIETDGLAVLPMVPQTDGRLSQIMKSNPIIEHLLSNFTDQFNTKHHPCVLIYNDYMPETVNLDAFIAFRNIVAISCISKGCKAFILDHQNITQPLYSDYFDFYPITLHGSGEYLVTISAVGMGVDARWNKFSGQTSPYLINPSNMTAEPDQHIFQAISKVWNSHFTKKYSRRKVEARRLFRSLEIAYQATRVPEQRILDYGTRIALWVSTFETLTHPGKDRKANLGVVLDFLNQAKFNSNRLNRKRYKIEYPKNTIRRVALIGKLYRQIYKARNLFLHGDPVKNKELYPFGDTHSFSFLSIAPLIYRTALQCYFKQMRILKTASSSEGIAEDRSRESDYERALIAVIEMMGDDND